MKCIAAPGGPHLSVSPREWRVPRNPQIISDDESIIKEGAWEAREKALKFISHQEMQSETTFGATCTTRGAKMHKADGTVPGSGQGALAGCSRVGADTGSSVAGV